MFILSEKGTIQTILFLQVSKRRIKMVSSLSILIYVVAFLSVSFNTETSDLTLNDSSSFGQKKRRTCISISCTGSWGKATNGETDPRPFILHSSSLHWRKGSTSTTLYSHERVKGKGEGDRVTPPGTPGHTETPSTGLVLVDVTNHCTHSLFEGRQFGVSEVPNRQCRRNYLRMIMS